MMENKINWGQIIIGIVIGALAVWAISAATKPATGTVVGQTYTGTITYVNKAMQAGKIQGDVESGASVQEYQFQIPEDLAAGYTPVINDKVKFDVSPYQAQDVSNIRRAAIACAIRSFAGTVNSDGSHTVIWETSGAASGFIRYIKLGDVFPNVTDFDVTASINAGTHTFSGEQLRDPSSTLPGYTLIITCAPDSDTPGERQNVVWRPGN